MTVPNYRISDRIRPCRHRAALLVAYSIARWNRCAHLLAFLRCWLPAWKGTRLAGPLSWSRKSSRVGINLLGFDRRAARMTTTVITQACPFPPATLTDRKTSDSLVARPHFAES